MRLRHWRGLTLAVLAAAMAMAYFRAGHGAGTKPRALPPSTVAIVRSERASADELTDEEIREMVRRAVALAGGLGPIIKQGDTVVLKPNLVEIRDYIGTRHPLPKLLSGVATDRRVVKAVAELAREAGAGEIFVMEGSALSTAEAFRYYGYTPENLPYVDAIIPIESDSGGWHEYDAPQLAKVDLQDGLYRKVYYLNRRYYEADVVISLPTLKNHWDAAVTGAVKNLAIGATPANIYGAKPGDFLRWPAIPHGNEDYHGFMHDFYKCKPARFAVMDGLVGIQRGPTPNSSRGAASYEECRMNMRCILASADPVAMDVVAALVMGWDPQTVKYLQYLGADGTGNADPADIQVTGCKVAEVRRNFAGVRPSGGGGTYTDNTPPQVKVARAEVKKDHYLLSLAAGKDTVRVEIYLDGRRAGVFKDGFANLSLSLGDLPAGEHRVRIVAFDRFLNDLVLERTLKK